MLSTVKIVDKGRPGRNSGSLQTDLSLIVLPLHAVAVLQYDGTGGITSAQALRDLSVSILPSLIAQAPAL